VNKVMTRCVSLKMGNLLKGDSVSGVNVNCK